MTLYLLAQYLGQAVWSLVVALLLFGFHRTYRRSYLRKWALSWAALAVHHAAGALGMRLVPWAPAAAPLRSLATAVALVAVYLGVVWLLLGTWEVAGGHVAGRRARLRLLAGAALFGLASAAVFTFAPVSLPLRMGVRLVVPEVVAGLAFLATGAAVWRARRYHPGTGPALLAAAFALYGAQRLHMASVVGGMLVGGEPAASLAVYGVVDLLLQSLMALGMAVWLFEEERRRALGAAAQIDRLSSHDPLTELMNRGSLFLRLHDAGVVARERGGRVLVAVVDLDRFKSVNDSFGQAAGDELLRAAAARLRRVVGDAESVARLAGDEFVVLRAASAAAGEERELAAELCAAFERPFTLADREVPIAVTVGVSRFPDDGADPEELVRNAGLALVEARRRRERYHVFDPRMSAAARERLDLELELRAALEEQAEGGGGGDGLDVAYQPVVDMESGRVERVEALVRWYRGGVEMEPFRFLPVAEVAGLADALDAWVLRRALAQAARWRAAGHPRLRIAVNLSSQRFGDPSLVEEVEEALREADVPAASLDLEVTERVAMQRADASLYTMTALQRLGVGLTIDDFGTGYSSLSYLRRLPVSALKIDRSFVDDLDGGTEAERRAARSIVRAVLSLGRNLGLAVVAEGVETAEQWRVLAAEGCRLVQGYYVARPGDAAACGELLARPSLLPEDAGLDGGDGRDLTETNGRTILSA